MKLITFMVIGKWISGNWELPQTLCVICFLQMKSWYRLYFLYFFISVFVCLSVCLSENRVQKGSTYSLISWHWIGYSLRQPTISWHWIRYSLRQPNFWYPGVHGQIFLYILKFSFALVNRNFLFIICFFRPSFSRKISLVKAYVLCNSSPANK